MAINKVILVGNLGSDPEVREFEGGKKVANFSIATTERYTDRDGQKKEITEWHKLELWDGLAGVAQQYLHKGDKLYVEGKLKTDTWQDKDGISRTTTKIRVERLEIMSNRNPAETFSTAEDNNDNDDLPF